MGNIVTFYKEYERFKLYVSIRVKPTMKEVEWIKRKKKT